MEPIEIPQYVDDPPQFLLWQIDQIGPLMIAAVVGVLADMLFLSLFLGVLASWAYSRLAESNPEGYAYHVLYAWGFTRIPGMPRRRTMPNPFIYRYLP